MNYPLFWMNANIGAHRGSKRGLLSSGTQMPDVYLCAIHPMICATRRLVERGVYERQPVIYESYDFRFGTVGDVMDRLANVSGALLWKRPTPPAANGV